MSSNTAMKKTTTTAYADVIPFPGDNRNTRTATAFDEFSGKDWSDPDFVDDLKDAVQTIISKALFQTSQLRNHQDPVDAVYISRLVPDNVSKVDIQTLERYSQIEDLSDTLEFSDGLDD